MAAKVTFEFDEPVALHLKYPQGMLIDNRFEYLSEQYLFVAEEGVFYLNDCAGGLLNARLRSLQVAAGDAVIITKRRVPNPNTDRLVIEYFCASADLTKPDTTRPRGTMPSVTIPRVTKTHSDERLPQLHRHEASDAA